MISIRFILTVGVTVFVTMVGGLVGGISIWGGVISALELTRLAQIDQTRRLAKEVNIFVQTIEQDVFTIAEVLSSSAPNLESNKVVNILHSFASNKEYLNSITLVRKNRTNVWVGEWQGEVISELNIELDDESYLYAEKGKPGDGTEGFEDIYIEPSEGRPVITYTKHFRNSLGNAIGTLYIDLGLSTLSSSLSKNQGRDYQRIFVFDGSGAVIAHPSLIGHENYKIPSKDNYKVFDRLPKVSSLDDPVAKSIYSEISKRGVDFQDIKVEEEFWLVSIAEIKNIGVLPWYAVSVVPRRMILGPMIDRSILVGLLGIFILIVAVSVAWVMGRSISKPLSRLAHAADAVKTLDIEIPTQKLSNVKELNSTEQAFRAMLKVLEVFIRYIPRNLVLKLIQLESKGLAVKAEEREMSILFTDVAGYTSISDGMNPQELAKVLNHYFEILVAPVTVRGGTVDKFIGDALMAFWNAPNQQDDHADLAITAALEIRKMTQEFNEKLIAKGEKPFVTRIGIHTGRVLVGNIGASERMNYTIVGDAVNIAARLEALGKEIGETLCISSQTREAAKMNYSWTEVERVKLRGCSQETLVYTIPQS